VPLFVKLPGNERAGTHVSHWVQSVDLMPSILRRVGLPIPDGVQGGSIQEGSTRVYAEESHEGNILESVRERRDFEELKLITANEGNPRGLAPVELYRVADDPTEQHNVAETQHDQVQALMRTMETEREAASVGAVEHERVRRLDHDEICNLCTLGYSDVEQCCRDGCLSGAACDGH
jgi:arylsulfatase A-like enzyme